MDGLQRSAISFRRQGSSGLVWEDRFISGELKKKEDLDKQKQQQSGGGKGGGEEVVEFRELRPSRSVGSAGAIGGGGGGITTTALERSRSNGGVGGGYRTGKVSPAIDPPSPKLSGCGFCSVFGKPQKSNSKNKNNHQSNNQRSKKGKRKS